MSASIPKPRCVVLDAFTLTEHQPGAPSEPGEPTWAALEESVELAVHPRTAAQDTVRRAASASLLLTNKVILGAAEMAQLPELRYIGVLATGTNVVDLAAAQARGVVVTNIPGYATESVVAQVFGLLLELCLGIGEHAQAVQAGAWQASPDFSFRLRATTDLAEKTLGIVGFGRIGRRVAAVAQALGMRVTVAHSSRGLDQPLAGVDAEFVDLDRLFATADVISLHCPLVPETRGLINAARLRQMKRGAFLINTGRGPLIDEGALADALRSGHLGGAGLDVLSVEPPPPDHPLIGAPRCRITPHIAWATQPARQRLMDIAVDNVKAYLAGSPRNRVA